MLRCPGLPHEGPPTKFTRMATRPVCNLDPKSGRKTVPILSNSGQIQENDASQQLSSELVIGHPVASTPVVDEAIY